MSLRLIVGTVLYAVFVTLSCLALTGCDSTSAIAAPTLETSDGQTAYALQGTRADITTSRNCDGTQIVPCSTDSDCAKRNPHVAVQGEPYTPCRSDVSRRVPNDVVVHGSPAEYHGTIVFICLTQLREYCSPDDAHCYTVRDVYISDSACPVTPIR